MIHRFTPLIFVVLCSWAAARGQELRDSVRINFRQSKTALDTAYMHNAQALHTALPDSNFYVLKKVEVTGAASPEGSVRFNEWLSRQRAERIFDRYSLPDSLATFTYLGRDWQGLRRMVDADPQVPYRNEVISLLDEIIARDAGGERESYGNIGKIKRLRGGEPYLYMYRRLFPALRASQVVLTYDRRIRDLYVPAPMETTRCATPLFHIPAPEIPPVEVKPLKPFYMDLRTNMLFDALAVPNIGVEFYAGKNYSVVANWMYGWWDTDRTHKYWRIYGGDLAVRKWFGRKAAEKPLQGHHIGVYAGVVTYDFEWGGTGYMGGLPGRPLWARCSYYGGIEYGYSKPIARRLNIDFTIGLGYLGGEYQVYDPEGSCYVWRETRMRHYFGPTKAEISLVWLLGRGNTNKRP